MVTIGNKFPILQKTSVKHILNDEYENLAHMEAAQKKRKKVWFLKHRFAERFS